MSDWDLVRKQVLKKRLQNDGWKSDRKHILEIIDYAEQIGMDPTNLAKTSISNLRTIVKVARRAIMNSDKKKLAEIFSAAATLRTRQLRLYTGAHELEVINYQEVINKDTPYYHLILTEKQFERIKNGASARYTFRKSNN